jgi:hypothetical protein
MPAKCADYVISPLPSFCSETLKDHAIALAFKRTLDDSRTKKGYISQNDIKNLLATTLVFSKSLLVFDLNDGSRDHSISLADFKRSLVHMDIRLPDIVANQVLQLAFICHVAQIVYFCWCKLPFILPLHNLDSRNLLPSMSTVQAASLSPSTQTIF